MVLISARVKIVRAGSLHFEFVENVKIENGNVPNIKIFVVCVCLLCVGKEKHKNLRVCQRASQNSENVSLRTTGTLRDVTIKIAGFLKSFVLLERNGKVKDLYVLE